MRQERCLRRGRRRIQGLEHLNPRTWQVRAPLDAQTGEAGRRMRAALTACRLEQANNGNVGLGTLQVTELVSVMVLSEARTPTEASRVAFTSAPKLPYNPSAFQHAKNDHRPLESCGVLIRRARFCASLVPCISYLRFTSISGNNNWKMATDKTSITWGLNVAHRYTTNFGKTRSAGSSLVFEVLYPMFESRVFVATLEIFESKETNLKNQHVRE